MSPAPTPRCGWGRTARRRAAVQWLRKGRKCPVRPRLRHKRYRPAPASSPTPPLQRCHGAATLLGTRAESPTQATIVSTAFVAFSDLKRETPQPCWGPGNVARAYQPRDTLGPARGDDTKRLLIEIALKPHP